MVQRDTLSTTRDLYDHFRFLTKYEFTRPLAIGYLSLAMKFAKLDWGETISFEVTKDFLIVTDNDKTRKEIIGMSKDGLHLCSITIPQDKLRNVLFEMRKTLDEYTKLYERVKECH
jgi:hypothetical protein